MLFFDKEINFKNYDCSKNGIDYPQKDFPIINLYIQTTPKCNAKCDFCNTRCQSKDFNFKKLHNILEEMKQKNIAIGKIAITGGEPLLEMDRVANIINICENHYITLNTNAYNLEKLSSFYPYVKEIHISKHHYDNKINDSIMKIKTPTIKDIYEYGIFDKVKINCVWQKGGIECYEDLIKMLELLGENKINELRSISLLPLNQKSIEKYIDLSTIMIECEKFINNGYCYDKNMCKCFEFVYLSQSGTVIKNLIRKTINDDYCCVKQLVFDGEYLYDGFKKNNIII